MAGEIAIISILLPILVLLGMSLGALLLKVQGGEG
ncbi:PetM family cytochrome b6-f complex subunit 7 [Prochlorothrix hollandica]|uniref:Cytochrome b6-f complex subunit 7 n=1 Tax=Prochlorothrix hollandica PCC 9006 = CALU 1027 TaxID=317619 RepID=A0A0M2PXY9_PROHO|nr:cytochrome B6 [Prochlorothrix hollandica PCC 9006 = CALU 1027]